MTTEMSLVSVHTEDNIEDGYDNDVKTTPGKTSRYCNEVFFLFLPC